MDQEIKKYKLQIKNLCDKFKVQRLYMFGSLANGSFSEKNSDIDLFVEMLPVPPIERGENLIDLWDQLELLFNRKVDLITDQPLNNPIFKLELDKTKKLIYDREKQEILI